MLSSISISGCWEGWSQCQARHLMDLKSIVSPAAKFHLAILIIKGEPSDVHGTGRHKDPWGEERFRPSLSYQFLPDLVGCRCRYHRWSPPRWSGRWSRKLHWHWIVDRSRVNIIKTWSRPLDIKPVIWDWEMYTCCTSGCLASRGCWEELGYPWHCYIQRRSISY